MRVSTRHHELLEAAFNAFDTGKKGYLTKEDLRQVFGIGLGGDPGNNSPTGKGDAQSERILSEAFKEMNQSGSSPDKLRYGDFLAAMKKVGATKAGNELKAVS